MKRVMLGTTALVAVGGIAMPAFAQEKISIGVGGYMQQWFGYTDQDDSDLDREFNPANVRQEGEIHFTGETTLDNGLTFGVNVQLEAITQSDQIDETFLFIQGNFGRILIGAENSAPYLMSYAAPYAGLGVNSPNFFQFEPHPESGASTSGYLNEASDANKITYFTPRFAGFQLGVSYAPNIDERGGDRQTFGLNTDEDPGDFNHVIGLGLNYVESFNSFDIALSGGAELANLEKQTAADDRRDYEAYSAGINLGYAGLTVGGSISYSNTGRKDPDDEGWFYDAGITYETGPWLFGATYSHSVRDYEGDGKDTRDLYEVGVKYKLSPGVTVGSAIQYMDSETDHGAFDDKIDGFGGGMFLGLSF